MERLHVDTNVLCAAAGDLVRLANAAHELADSHVRAARLAPAVGLDEPAQAVDSFLNSWAYGIRWIAAQAEQIGRDLRHSADTFAVIDARLAQAAGGAAFAPVLSAPPATMVEAPLPMVRHWTGVLAPPMQLAHATRADQLIPGDPDQVKLLQHLIGDFAEAAYATRSLMRGTTLGGWTGAAAQAVEAELTQLHDRLTKAEEAFENAAGALTGYVTVHADAQAEAAEAIRLWQSAILASQVARGAAVGPAPPDAPADPDAVLTRAGALAQDAIERQRLAGKTLAEVMREAREGAPKDPGFWAHVRRAVASFGLGLSGTAFEVAEVVPLMAELVKQFNPARMIYDPHGYWAAQEALYTGAAHALAHPDEVGAALINWDEMKQDPARWLGEMLPDFFAIGMAARGAGLFNRVESIERLKSAGKVIEGTKGSVLSRMSPSMARERLAELGIDARSEVGRASRKQLDGAYGHLDRWEAKHLPRGTRLAVVDGGKAVVPFEGDLTRNAGEFYESVQAYGERHLLDDGTASEPLLAGSVKIYYVDAPDGMNVAEAIARANEQFGAGGGTHLFVPDLSRATTDGRLVELDVHDFDPRTLKSAYEDPRYRAVDPDLPTHALDPEREKLRGYVEGFREKGLETARDTAVRTAEAAAVGASDGNRSE